MVVKKGNLSQVLESRERARLLLMVPRGGGGVLVGILGGGMPPSSSNPDSIPDPKM